MSSFGRDLRELNRTTRNLLSRLRSIEEDGRLAEKALAPGGPSFEDLSFPIGAIPIFANLRCGLWYVPRPMGTCYFKSTDGHYGKWSVSRTRINMHVVDAIVAHGGLCIVDATQHGKTFPDSMSKTIPLWCHVVNECFSADVSSLKLRSQLPRWITDSETAAMEPAVNEGVALFRGLSVEPKARLSKPIRCFFAARGFSDIFCDGAGVPFSVDCLERCFPLFLYCASGDASVPRERRGWNYVAGAGDDEESWARGLTPQAFWDNVETIIIADAEEDVEDLVEIVVAGRATARETVELAIPAAVDSAETIFVVAEETTARHGPTLTHSQATDSHTLTFHILFNPGTQKDFEIMVKNFCTVLESMNLSRNCFVIRGTSASIVTAIGIVIEASRIPFPALSKASLQDAQRRVSNRTTVVPPRCLLRQLNRALLAHPLPD